MKLNLRPYNYTQDFQPVSQFLINTCPNPNTLPLWPQPRWEYMHFHPDIKQIDTTLFSIAEYNREIVGVVHCEGPLFRVYFQVHPDYPQAKPLLFELAEKNFSGYSDFDKATVRILHIHQDDEELTRMARENGYEMVAGYTEDYACLNLTQPGIFDYTLPEGHRVQTLADENELRKINQVLWRGFNHPGPPPEEEIEGRLFGQQAPNFRKDLTAVAVAPNGDYVSYCGMWLVPQNKLAYIEPVAADPDYRRKGLGRAAVLESLKRARQAGAETAWVVSGLEFYLSMGFEISFRVNLWVKRLD